jgi:serine phosphatase RsbU (regulator of sigma subunit)
MLSFALGDKMKMFLLEKEEAQRSAFLQLKENERLVREQNVFLEQKVQERTTELVEKNKEILDSIHYARRIQSTLLAQEQFVKKYVLEHFILFKPKDIVSGDFYWASQKENRFYLAVCDCTGHGVPGAFMSLLNISFLNEAVNEKNISRPNEILNHVRQRLIENISYEGRQDGMDGILLCIDLSNNKMSYAAAYNRPLLVRNKVLLELKADKMPVGKGEKEESFALFELDLQPKDSFYMYTDGYADQFGGPKKKKFLYKQLEELIRTSSDMPAKEQMECMVEKFESWKGDCEQVDDVLVIGIKMR